MKFTAEGSVTLSSSVEDGQLRLAVEDTGMGIRIGPEPQLFGLSDSMAIFTGRGDGVRPGPGHLQAPGAHDGRRGHRRNQVGRGQQATDLIQLSEGEDVVAKEHLLLIEDNEQNRYLVRFMLEKHAFAVVEACNAAEAFDCVEKKLTALIILDIQLPGMDGYQLAQRLRRDWALAAYPHRRRHLLRHGRRPRAHPRSRLRRQGQAIDPEIRARHRAPAGLLNTWW